MTRALELGQIGSLASADPSTSKFSLDGKIVSGNEIGNANISNIINTASSSGLTAYRPINLVDTSASLKVARITDNDTADVAYEMQTWDSTITTNTSYWDIYGGPNGMAIRDRYTTPASRRQNKIYISPDGPVFIGSEKYGGPQSKAETAINSNTNVLQIQGNTYIYGKDSPNSFTEQILTASDGAAGDNFGYSVAIGAGYVVSGAPIDDSSTGAIYIDSYIKNGVTQVKVTASDAAAGDKLGWSVDVGDNKIVVGAVGKDSSTGGAYIYDLDGTNEVILEASDRATSDSFGVSVAIGEDKVVIGALNEDTSPNSNQGAAYIYNQDGTNEIKLVPSDAASNDEFGISVAIDNGKAIIGARYATINSNSNAGAVYTFNLDGTGEAKITSSDSAAGDTFGYSVAAHNGKIVVGAIGYNTSQGKAYIYDTDGTNEIILTAPDGAVGDRFGYKVDVFDGRVIVGSYQDDSNTGAAYLYKTDGTYITKLVASDATSGDQFGRDVSLSGGMAAVAAADASSGAGATYTYDLVQDTGRVGIGTTDPQGSLHIYRQDTRSGGGTGVETHADLILENPGRGNARFFLKTATNNRNWEFFADDGDGGFGIYDGVGVARRFTILPNGNVGINSGTPGANLEVVQSSTDTYGTGVARFTYIDTNSANNAGSPTTHFDAQFKPGHSYFKSFITGNSTDFLVVDKDNSSTRAAFAVEGNGGNNKILYVLSGGNVGIGTTNPVTTLDVAGGLNLGIANSASSTQLQIGSSPSANRTSYIDLIGDTTYTDFGARFIRNGGAAGKTQIDHRGTGEFQLRAYESAPIVFYTNGTTSGTNERGRFTNHGLELIDNSLIVSNTTFGTYTWETYQTSSGDLIFTVGGTSGAEMKLTSDGSNYFNARLEVAGNTLWNGGLALSINDDIYFNSGALISNDADGAFADRSGTNIDHIWHNDSGNHNGTGGSWTFVSDGTYKSSTSSHLSQIHCGHVLVSSGTLGSAAGDTQTFITGQAAANANVINLIGKSVRKVAGSDWTSSSVKLLSLVDSTEQGYIEFNPHTSTAGDGNYDVAIGSNNGEIIRFTNEGDVGVGTTNPTFRFESYKNINGAHQTISDNPNSGASAYTSFRLRGSGGSAYWWLNSSGRSADGGTNTSTLRNDTGDLRLQASGQVGMHIQATTGNVGIGTNNPGAKLDVNGDIYVGDKIATRQNPTTSFLDLDDDNDPGVLGVVGSSNSVTLGSISGINLIFDTNNNDTNGLVIGSGDINTANATKHLVVSSSGNVGIGTNNPSSKLEVVGTVNFSDTLTVDGNSNQLLLHPGTTSQRTIIHRNDGSNYFILLSAAGDSASGVWSSERPFRIENSTADIHIANSRVLIEHDNGNITTSGALSATTKSFVIDHPTKKGKKLRYGSLEGPENGVYVRGKSDLFTIDLPDYWTGLVDEDSITVNLTPIGSAQQLWVESISDNKVFIGSTEPTAKYFFTVFGERKDVEKFEVEY